MNLDLTGKTALVTGASLGLGRAMAQAFHAAGANVALVARRPHLLEDAKAAIEAASGGRVRAYPCDVTDAAMVERAVAATAEELGPVDILVNNAGHTRRAPAERISPADWDFVVGLNLTAVFRLCQAFGRDRIAQAERAAPAAPAAKIINIASLMSEQVRADNAPYAATKGAIRQLTKSLAVDWAKYRINVNAIGPGYVKTDLTRPLWEDAEFDAWVRRRAPLGAWGAPADIGAAAVFFAAPAADYVTGQILYVDGGWLSSF